MRTQRYLPRIQNGRVAKRQTRSKNTPVSKSSVTTNTSTRRRASRVSNRMDNHRHKRDGEGRGSNVMWVMILIGVTLATGFVFALRSQINAHNLGQAEEQLRVKLDEYTSQQKFLMLDQQRALNVSESDRAGRQGGLDQLKLDQPGIVQNASVQRVVQQVSAPVKPSQAGRQNRPSSNRLNSNRLSKQPVKNNQAAKSLTKSSKKPALKANAAKLSAAKARAKKESVKQQQASRSRKKR
ncbi:MAG: hypothetical protein AB7U82_28945 [Blastocatellales bacterium]